MSIPEVLNAKRYEKIRERYGTRGPVAEPEFLHAFRADPYSAETWLYAVGGTPDAADVEKARAEDARIAEVLKRPLGGPRWVPEAINRNDRRGVLLYGERDEIGRSRKKRAKGGR